MLSGTISDSIGEHMIFFELTHNGIIFEICVGPTYISKMIPRRLSKLSNNDYSNANHKEFITQLELDPITHTASEDFSQFTNLFSKLVVH